MSFSYQFGANPTIDYPRMLISDTQQFAADGTTRIYIFEDSEISSAQVIVTLPFQSSMFYSGTAGANLPASPTNYLRCAALLLNSIAANKSRLASIKQLLDVKLDSTDAAEQMRETAQMYLDMDDNSGAFFIAEQVNTVWAFKDRFWSQVQRQSGGGF